MSVLLEDFSNSDRAAAEARQGALSAADAEALRSEAYGQGYQAGWDDAINSRSEEEAAVEADLARHFQEMSFSFHEARAHLVQSIEPLLEEILQVFLPDVVRATMGERILQTLEPLIAEASSTPVEIRVAPGQKDSIESRLSGAPLSSFSIAEEETLSDGQAFLRLGKAERKVDLTEAMNDVRASLHAISQLNEKALDHE